MIRVANGSNSTTGSRPSLWTKCQSTLQGWPVAANWRIRLLRTVARVPDGGCANAAESSNPPAQGTSQIRQGQPKAPRRVDVVVFKVLRLQPRIVPRQVLAPPEGL